VVPVAAAAGASWVLRSWDRFRVPRPFARVIVACGEPVQVPPDLDRAEAERWRARLESLLESHTRAVAQRAGEPA
jgi:hypothetical protein